MYLIYNLQLIEQSIISPYYFIQVIWKSSKQHIKPSNHKTLNNWLSNQSKFDESTIISIVDLRHGHDWEHEF